MKPEEYQALSEEERRQRRQELSEKAMCPTRTQSTFFGVIGRGLDKSEREAIIEYVKSL